MAGGAGGPHARLVPEILRAGRSHAATAPIPPGLVPCGALHPPHPAKDGAGRAIPFVRARHEAFQAILDAWGDPALVAAKRAAEAGRAPPRKRRPWTHGPEPLPSGSAAGRRGPGALPARRRAVPPAPRVTVVSSPPETSRLSRRLGLLAALLVVGNVGAWLWAWSAFAHSPTLLSTALLAYVFGLRHAVDPDHIAAIDNVTRKLLQAGQRPVSVGLWFALGHSTIVIAAAAAVALATTSLLTASDEFRQLGNLIGTGVSAGFLIVIGLVNFVILAGVWRSFRQVRRTGRYEEADLDGLLAGQVSSPGCCVRSSAS